MSSTIYHFGIKGMKWGIRRYQNKDGSLTAAGKKRYSESGGEKKDISTKTSTSTSERPSTTRPKTVSEMNDSELRERINRLNLEKQYRQLVNDGASNNTPQVSEGKKFANDLKKRAMDNVLLPAVEDIGRQIVRSKLADFTNKTFKFEGDKMVFANNKKK